MYVERAEQQRPRLRRLYPVDTAAAFTPCRPSPIRWVSFHSMRRLALAIALVVHSSANLVAQVTATPPWPDSAGRRRPAEHVPRRSRADTLRGSFATPGRKWWDVTFYDLHVAIQPNDSSIAGYNGITYKVLEPAAEMQIDLMEPLVVDSTMQDGRPTRRIRSA